MYNPYGVNLGGRFDAAALLALTGAGLSTTPLLASGIPGLIGPGLAGAGAGWLTWRYAHEIRNRNLLKTKLKIKSSPQQIKASRTQAPPESLLFGYTTDKGEPIYASYKDLMGHLVIRGQSGVGKSVGASLLMFQHILNGGSLLFIDGKLDYDTLEMIHLMHVWAGREHDLRVINPGDPGCSNTYNPILYGDPDEVAARILSLIPDTSQSPGADHYRQSANQGLTTLIAAIQRAGLAYNFIDLTILLQSSAALEYLEKALDRVAPDSPERINLAIFLNQFRVKGGAVNTLKLKEVFGGIGGRMYQFGTGKFGQVTNHYNPEVSLYDDLRAQRSLYVMLPTMGKAEAASNFGKMVTGDLRTTISWLQALPKHQRPWPPTFGFFDEAGSYILKIWDRMFEQSRSSHTILAPAFQTDANLEAISEELREMVEGNTWLKMFYKLGTQRTAEAAAELIGYHMAAQKTMAMTDSRNESAQMLRDTPDSNVGQGSGMSYTEREEERYRVSPDDLKSLDRGEAIMTYGGDALYNVRVPMIEFSKEFRQSVPKFQPNHFRPPYRRGIGLYKRIREFITSERLQELDNEAKSKGGKTGG